MKVEKGKKKANMKSNRGKKRGSKTELWGKSDTKFIIFQELS